MLCWLASGEHEAVQVVTLQFSSVQLFNFRILLFPKENEVILRNHPLPPSSRDDQMLCWRASGEHEAVQVENPTVVQSQNPAISQGKRR